MIYGNCVGGVGIERTYILVDEDGNEFPATFVDNETTFDATANDIRIGKVAATEAGVTQGEKVIPSYNTTEGYFLITNGSTFTIPLGNALYDFTKLQCIICPFSGSVTSSVAAEKVVIDDNVYNVNSTEVISPVSRDSDNERIDLGFVNDSETLYLLRFFTYKEVY